MQSASASCLAGAVTIAGSELRLGMSVGQAETAVPADADAAAHKELATALLLAADQDMYRVKTEMRGAVGAGLIPRALTPNDDGGRWLPPSSFGVAAVWNPGFRRRGSG